MFKLIQVGFWLTFFFNWSFRQTEKVAVKEKIIRPTALKLFKYLKNLSKYSDFVNFQRCNWHNFQMEGPF